jgi:hypothetical protein
MNRFQRLTLLAASTTLITGGALLPGAAFAATMTPAGSVAVAEAQWVETRDAPSGVEAQFPKKPTVMDLTESGGRGRIYTVPTAYGSIALVVHDKAADEQTDLKGDLQAFLDGYNQSVPAGEALTGTDIQEGTTQEGYPSLDATLAADNGDIGGISFIDVGDHVVMTFGAGDGTQKAALLADYNHLVDTLRVPDAAV